MIDASSIRRLDLLGGFQLCGLGRDQPEDRRLAGREVTEWLETTSALAVELEKERVDVEAAEDPLGDRFVAPAGDPPAPEVATAHVRRDEEVVGSAGDDRVHSVAVPHDHVVGIVAARLHLLAKVGVTQIGEADVVELQVATARFVQRGDFAAIGLDEVDPVLLDVGIRILVDDLSTTHEAGHPGAGDRDLGNTLLRDRCKVGERVDEDRCRVTDLADDDGDRRAFPLALEVGRSLPLRQADSVETVEKVEMPPIAAELAVGHGGDADGLLMGDELVDAVVFDLGQRLLRGLAVPPRLARCGQSCGA